MSDTQQPQTPAEQAEANYSENLIWRLVGSKITMFGCNVNGEIFLRTERDGALTEVVVGKDELGDICLFEVEKKEVNV